MYPPGRAEVEAAGRLHGDDEPRRWTAGELAGGDDLLLVAAGKIGRSRERLRRPNVESGDERARLRTAALAVDERAARVGRRALVAEGEILLDAEGQAERAAVAIFGEVHDPRGAGGGGSARPSFGAVQPEGAARGAQAGQDFGQLGLSIAVDSGDAEDFAAGEIEREAVQGGAAAIGEAGEVAGFEEDVRPA